MSALPPKADMCGATRDVRFGPKADITDKNAQIQTERDRPRPMAGSSLNYLLANNFGEASAMALLRTIAGNIAVFSTLISVTYAGPCSDDIAQAESRLNKRLEAVATARPSGPQDATAFGKHLQPTPRTVVTAEGKLGELSQQKIDAIRHAMERARAADAAGDKSACVQALADLERELGH